MSREENTFHTAVMAGAGTGKTYSLVENYLCALFGLGHSLEKKRPSEILALTFTQKAAHEMRLRITKRLSEFLVASSDPLVEMAHAQGVSLPDADEIKRLLRALPNAPIATFHSFCADVLRKEAEAIGIDDSFEILTPDEEQDLARNILRPIILEEIKKPASPLKAIVARTRLGNGLTYGLVDGLLKLYFKLFEKGIKPTDLLAPSKNRAICAEILNDVRKALADFFLTKASPKAQERLLEISRAVDCLSPFLEPFQPSQVNRKFLQLRQSAAGNFGELNARQALVKEIVKLGAQMADYQSLADEICLAGILGQFHEQFEAIKKTESKISYSDLLTKTKNALLNDLELRARVKKSLKHLLVDEYQDTSPLQEDIISLLLEDKARAQVLADERLLAEVSFFNGPSLFVVGDKKQSIYGFRGADASLFDNMVQKMAHTHKDSDRFSKRLLTTNRRSKKSILSLVNLVAFHTLKDQGYDFDQALIPNTLDAGCTSLWVNQDDKEDSPGDANLHCAAFGVAKLLETGRVAKDVVILVRRIKAASVLKEHLQNLGIASRIVGGEGFFKAQEVVDLLCFLRLINHPGDSLALAIVLRSPLVLLSEQEILEIAMLGDITVPHALDVFKSGVLGACPRLERLFVLLEKLRATAGMLGLSATLDELIIETDYAYALGLMDNPGQKWANVEKLSAMLLKSPKNPFSLIDEYYGHIFNQTREPQALGEVEEDACTIMTIHQSKGLEFKVVVLADGEASGISNYEDFLVDKNLGLCLKPKAMAGCAPKGPDILLAQTRYDQCKESLKVADELERARLLYVAMTRAKEELYIACSYQAYTAKESAKTLVGLFLKSFHNNQDQFLATCGIEFITKTEHHYEKAPVATKEVELFSYQIVVKRIFASSLVASTKELSSLVHKQEAFKRFIDGDCAHKLLSLAGPATLAHSFDDGMLDKMLATIARSQPLVSDNLSETVRAVKTTLKMLKTALLGHEKAIFELPLFCKPLHVVVEGFADLVVEFADFIGVIEFKSSLRLVNEPNTYLQVLAYAHALSTLKPIKFAVVLVGSSEVLFWQDYDEQAKQMFLSEIALAAGNS